MPKKCPSEDRPPKPSSGAGRNRSGDQRGSTERAVDQEISQIDHEILALINRRSKLILGFSREQAATRNAEDRGDLAGLSVPPRWQELIDANPGPIEARAVNAVFREIHSGCLAVGQPSCIAYLGPAFTYSHLAAIEQFGQSAHLIPVGTIASVFEEVAQGDADYGLVPIDNSTDGRVTDTLVCLAKSCLPSLQRVQPGPQQKGSGGEKACHESDPSTAGSNGTSAPGQVAICAEVPLRIGHCLLGIGSRNEIRQVISKPQALSQCRNWLAKHLPDAHLLEVASTAEAARKAAKKRSIAAIASKQAGIHHGLAVLASHIEDNPDNVTRFVVIAKQPGKQTGNDKTSIVFEVIHSPGALADAMGIFKRHQLNLTWIESFPVPGSRGRYLFFVEFQGHPTDAGSKKALVALDKKALRLGILGSYAQADPIV
jgi:chorismate mutase / prephenate dehydratase